MNFTLFQYITGALVERLDISPAQLLSALNTLSATPVDPYDRAKYELFGPDYKFKTFQEIEAPEGLTLETAQEQLSCVIQKHRNNLQTTLSAHIQKYLEKEGMDTYNEYEIIDPETAKRNILMIETMKTLTLEEIDSDPVKVAEKILSYYTSTF